MPYNGWGSEGGNEYCKRMLEIVYCLIGECRGTVALLLVFWVREWWLFVLSVFCCVLVGWREMGVKKTEAGYAR